MKTQPTSLLFIAAVVIAALGAFAPSPARAQTEWEPYNTDHSMHYSYQNFDDKGFESGFVVNGGHVLTQPEIDEANAHIGLRDQTIQSSSYGAMAHVNIPLD